jgi:hypothetical protein
VGIPPSNGAGVAKVLRLGIYAGWKLSEAKKETTMNKLTLLTALLLAPLAALMNQ